MAAHHRRSGRSQEAIKELGTNGGGFDNVNSAHPFENPTSWTSWIQIFLLLVIPFSLRRVFGRMVGQNRQGYAIVAAMGILAIASVALNNAFELGHDGTVPQAVAAAMESEDVRFGVANSATFAAATTLTSTGAVNSFNDSYTSLGGMMPMINMMLGEVAPGGAGLYGTLVLAVITVFVAGLMVGRTGSHRCRQAPMNGREPNRVLPDGLADSTRRRTGPRGPVPDHEAGHQQVGISLTTAGSFSGTAAAR
ncbi:hypothetical protein GCM10023170_082680 [Phytohabitans houttuyneae]|uniref:Potassium-transporting ATPase A chain n=1 Tax=Phytohabitans houttuyneae TaxID=1076126 RepID=A0A6V8KES4_9ACTN|nr:hypothetical protein Phou_061300 [Phytohabitans houttuyneae]